VASQKDLRYPPILLKKPLKNRAMSNAKLYRVIDKQCIEENTQFENITVLKTQIMKRKTIQ
jgi:hypothetical protein